MNELSSYVFSPLREGDIALYRGSGNGLAPILLVAAEDTSLGSVERLEHEYALKGELDADWAARPVALTHHNGRMTLVLEDPGGAPLDRLLGRPMEVSHFLRIAILLARALRQVHERGLIHKDIKPANILMDIGKRRRVADGVRHRLASAARTSSPRATGGDRRHSRLHGAGTDRQNESLGGLPQRSLCTGRHLLRNVDGKGARSPLPIRWSGCTAISRGNRCRPTNRSRASRSRSRQS